MHVRHNLISLQIYLHENNNSLPVFLTVKTLGKTSMYFCAALFSFEHLHPGSREISNIRDLITVPQDSNHTSRTFSTFYENRCQAWHPNPCNSFIIYSWLQRNWIIVIDRTILWELRTIVLFVITSHLTVARCSNEILQLMTIWIVLWFWYPDPFSLHMFRAQTDILLLWLVLTSIIDSSHWCPLFPLASLELSTLPKPSWVLSLFIIFSSCKTYNIPGLRGELSLASDHKIGCLFFHIKGYLLHDLQQRRSHTPEG